VTLRMGYATLLPRHLCLIRILALLHHRGYDPEKTRRREGSSDFSAEHIYGNSRGRDKMRGNPMPIQRTTCSDSSKLAGFPPEILKLLKMPHENASSASLSHRDPDSVGA
jgi:hypothetical protein